MNERAHPYIPNSAPAVRAEMLAAIGVDSVEALYASVPEALRLRAPLDMPAPMTDTCRPSWTRSSTALSS